RGAAANARTHDVTTRITTGSSCAMGVKTRAQKLRRNPPVDQQGDRIHIGRIHEPELRKNVFIDYDLYVPQQTRLTLRTGAGNQFIQGTLLPLEAWSGAGSITVDSVGGDAEIHTGAGRIEVRSPKGASLADTRAG